MLQLVRFLPSDERDVPLLLLVVISGPVHPVG